MQESAACADFGEGHRPRASDCSPFQQGLAGANGSGAEALAESTSFPLGWRAPARSGSTPGMWFPSASEDVVGEVTLAGQVGGREPPGLSAGCWRCCPLHIASASGLCGSLDFVSSEFLAAGLTPS